MTAEESVSFDEAARLNTLAAVLVLHGCGYEASWYLEQAAQHAVSPEARVVLQERAKALRQSVLWRALLAWTPTTTH